MMAAANRWMKTAGFCALAFVGGSLSSRLSATATTQTQNPYAPLEQLAKVLVLVENSYVEPASRNKMIEGAIKGMVAELDPHSAYMNPDEYALFQSDTEGKFGGIGVEVDFRGEFLTVIAPIEGSPAERAGVQPGDQILAINNKPLRGETMDKLVTMMRGPTGSKVHLTLRRKNVNDVIQLDLVREEIRVRSIVSKRLGNDVGYLRIRQFQQGTHTDFLRAAGSLRSASQAPLRGVLVDMRNNPGGLVDEAEAIADEFLSSGMIYSTRHRGRVLEESAATEGGAFASIPVVVLVNEYSASSAELVAGALQDNRRASIVGNTTFGKGSVQTIFDLPQGAGMRLTTMRYYTPSGRSIQAEGIKPDVMIGAPGSDAQGAEAFVLRERDLDGHLAAEQAKAPAPASATVVVNPSAASAANNNGSANPILVRAEDIPEDPSKGSDFALAVAYDLLLKKLDSKKP